MGWTLLGKFATPSGEIRIGRETEADGIECLDN